MSINPHAGSEGASYFIDSPLKPTRSYTEVLRHMAARDWVKRNRDRDVKSMSREERDCFNRLVLLEMAEVAAVLKRLRRAEKTSSQGANNVVWIQGPAAAGKTTVALEAAAAFCDPDSVGHLAVPSEDQISYAHIPVAIIAGQGNQMAGLQSGACEWLGQGPGRSGDDSGTRFAEMLTRCRTRVLIIDDLHAVKGGSSSVNSLRVLLNKVPTLLVLVSLPPHEPRESNVATALTEDSYAAKQFRVRTTVLRLGKIVHVDFDAFADNVRRRLKQFKLLNPCPQEEDIIEYLWVQSKSVERVETLAQVYNLLSGVAAQAVGCEEAVTLPSVMEATCD